MALEGRDLEVHKHYPAVQVLGLSVSLRFGGLTPG